MATCFHVMIHETCLDSSYLRIIKTRKTRNPLLKPWLLHFVALIFYVTPKIWVTSRLTAGRTFH